MRVIRRHFRVGPLYISDGVRYCVTVKVYKVKKILFVEYKEYVDTLYYADWEDCFNIYEDLLFDNPHSTWEVIYNKDI